jgi:hypothetical protein
LSGEQFVGGRQDQVRAIRISHSFESQVWGRNRSDEFFTVVVDVRQNINVNDCSELLLASPRLLRLR